LATEDELKVIEKDARALIEEATEQARAAQLPDEKELLSDVYIEDASSSYIRGIEYDQSRFNEGKYWSKI